MVAFLLQEQGWQAAGMRQRCQWKWKAEHMALLVMGPDVGTGKKGSTVHLC